ncbi:coronin-7-like isoform X2 [Liolophura sinensis]|uniref:coronin-7-like isoform X2 n=1 Tax=Liolophura sinensis TaxID=3198878 RepID=UPI0031591827
MAWRFKASKFKNAAPKFPKKEDIITGISAQRILQSSGNHIKASCLYMVFNQDSGTGGSLGVLPLNSSGRQYDIPRLEAHSESVTDFDFSPFDDSVLVTGSSDLTVKLWTLPDDPSELKEADLSRSTGQLPPQSRRIENLLWHPCAEGILALSAGHSLKVYDVNRGEEVADMSEFGDQIQSISWRGSGALLASSCKDRQVRIIDPRANSIVQQCEGHEGIKDCRVIWLGDRDQLLSTGFDNMRSREVFLWDCRHLTSPTKTFTLDSSTGTIMPFYDPDTNMVFLISKADSILKFWELSDKDPFLSESGTDRTEQIKGCTMVPKRALDVMSGEANRLLLLNKASIQQASYIVPRKSYRDFHADIFPDTNSLEPSMTADEWLAGANTPVRKVSLNPAKAPPLMTKRGQNKGQATLIQTHKTEPGPHGNGHAEPKKNGEVKKPERSPPVNRRDPPPVLVEKIEPAPQPTPIITDLNSQGDVLNNSTPPVSQERPRTPPRERFERNTGANIRSVEVDGAVADVPMRLKAPQKVFAGIRQSKFRHLKATVAHKDTHITNLRKLCKTIPGESDMFHTNTERCAVPLEGPGGLVAILELNKPGKLFDVGVPAVQNVGKVTDFAWDPFDNHKLLVACDDGRIRIWEVPDDLEGTLTEPQDYLIGHTEKVFFIRFHPLAQDVLVSASYDLTLRVWDLTDNSERYQLHGHTDHIFCASWSPDGRLLATACRDRKLRIFDPRSSDQPIKEGNGPEGNRGARIVWALGGRYLVVSGFTKTRQRELSIYNVENLEAPLSREGLDSTPAILIPYYDEDSSTLLLTGRGDSTVVAFEVSEEYPHFFRLSDYKGTLHQALSFLPKCECDVRKVEFARGSVLRATTVEPIAFSVPRVKKDYFQDDIFPDTKVTWKPAMSSAEWFSGMNRAPAKVSLRPADMQLLSEAPEGTPTKKFPSYNAKLYKTDTEKKEEDD